MEKFRVYGASVKEESQRERDHRALARKAASEGMTLLKNDGVLPLQNKKIALYGSGARMTVKGGSGSGEVNERYSVSIEQGLLNAGFTIPNTLWMDRFDTKYEADKAVWRASVEKKIKGYGPARTMKMFDIIHENPMPYPSAAAIQDDELSSQTDTAVYVVTRRAGEGGDRLYEKGDYMLSDIEEENIRKLAAYYKKFLLVINCGGVIDLSILDETANIGAVLYFAQGGMEGGNAFADLVSGKASPSGKLTDTWGMRYSDYPSADTYSHRNGVLDHESYFEGIYVGYRWFDVHGKKPRYPFGFGLCYTEFQHTAIGVSTKGTGVTVKAAVKNTGDTYSGKEILQLYLSKPQGRLDHERKGLVAFAKTKELAPGEAEELTLNFDFAEQASFDESTAKWILEAGEYVLLLGNSSDNVKPCAVLTLTEEVITEKVKHICPKKHDFTDYQAKYTGEPDNPALPHFVIESKAFRTITHTYGKPHPQETGKIRSILDRMSDADLISLCVGGGYSSKGFNNIPGVVGQTSVDLLKKGIPNIALSDGPAGLRVMQTACIQRNGSLRYPEGLPADWQWGYLKYISPLLKAKPGKGRFVYHYMSAFPCETLLAQSWNTELLETVGKAVGREMKEIGVTVWLAPGMNLHRNPLCGRNFEYYSEDPLVSGKMAAAITRGVQSNAGCGVTIKHFCCNNQEDNRDHVSENVSERALRELYLRGFKIAITESKPWAVMTSYNKVNDVYTPNSYDLVTKVLRNEWGFGGLVMSDWNSTDKCSHAEAISAGNDLLMPGNKKVRKTLTEALREGALSREDLRISAARVLTVIFNSAVADGF